MAGRVRRCALMLALLQGALFQAALLPTASVAEAGSLDCWLLDGGDLDQAREQGLCQDAFSRNSETGKAPEVAAPGAPIPGRKPPPPSEKPVRAVSRTSKVTTTNAQASRVVRPAGRADTADADFGTRFQRDWSALMRLFRDGGPHGPSSAPPNGGPASTPTHMSRNDR
ncbi:hypothetical protein [Azospirillum sp. sgz302134]